MWLYVTIHITPPTKVMLMLITILVKKKGADVRIRSELKKADRLEKRKKKNDGGT